MTLGKLAPDFAFEDQAQKDGYHIIAGVDEAGRGPLAGAVVAAAVILDPDNLPFGLNDSKKLTEKKRELIFHEIMATSHVGFCCASAEVIDRLNIRGATLWAMANAVKALSIAPELALIDGRDIPPALPCAGRFVIGGDAKSLSIAAASIVAKVMRDRMCAVMDGIAPEYGFAKHKGYGTAVHMAALQAHGPVFLHRESYAPVRLASR